MGKSSVKKSNGEWSHYLLQQRKNGQKETGDESIETGTESIEGKALCQTLS